MVEGRTIATAEISPGTIPLGEVEPESFRKILENWFRQAGNAGAPDAALIDPFIVPSLAANIILFELDGEDVRYRVVGEDVKLALKRDVRGLTVRDVLGDTDYGRLIHRQFAYAVENRCPLHSVHFFKRPEDSYATRALRILMPYATDGVVTRLLAYQIFEPGLETPPPSGSDLQEILPRTVFRVIPDR